MRSLFILIVVLVFTKTVFAQEKYELGVILGSPTGLSSKMHLANNRSIDAVIAHSLAHDIDFEFHSDYLIEKAHTFDINAPEPLELYFGIGARLGLIDGGEDDNELAIGPRVPIGVAYKFHNPVLTVFGEAALILNIIPETDADVDAGVGVRYRF